MRKNSHSRLLRGEPKEQHLNTVHKSCSLSLSLSLYIYIYIYIFRLLDFAPNNSLATKIKKLDGFMVQNWTPI